MANTKSKPRPGSDIENSPSDLGARITHYLQAGYPGLYLVSPEEQRVEAELKSVTDHLNRDRAASEHYQLCYWSVVDGLVNTQSKQVNSANDPLEVLQAISEQPERTIFLMKDYHLFLQDPNPIIVRKFCEAFRAIRQSGVALFIAGQHVRRILNVADLAFLIEDGKITLSGSGDEIFGDAHLQRILFGSDIPAIAT